MDLPRRAPPPSPPPLPVFTWTGFYAGLNAGYAVRIDSSGFTDPTYGTVTGGKSSGGFAYDGGSRASSAASYPYTPPGTDRTGYAAGGGIEYAFTEKLSARVEALYIHLGRGFIGSTYYNASFPAYYGAGKQDSGFALVRAGVNYRF